MNGPCFMGCCGCDPTTTKVCVTARDLCTSSTISGATVVIKNSGGTTIGSGTTNGSGQFCQGVTKKDTYTAVVSKTGYWDSLPVTTTFTACGTTKNVVSQLGQTTATVTCSVSICCGCPTDGASTVTVSVAQTVGGTATATCTISSGFTCTLSLPTPQPTATNTGAAWSFTFTWTAPGFVTQTTTYTMPEWVGGWGGCDGTATPSTMVTPSGDFCFPGSDCFAAAPASVSVTFSDVSDAPCSDVGPFTVPLDSLTPCGARYFTNAISTACGTLSIEVQITQSGCSAPSASVLASLPGGGKSYSMNAGTAACPIAFTAIDSSIKTVTVME